MSFQSSSIRDLYAPSPSVVFSLFYGTLEKGSLLKRSISKPSIVGYPLLGPHQYAPIVQPFVSRLFCA